jgi:hypothetical protein
MTRKSFYRKLRKIADQFTWKVDKGGSLRARRGKLNYCPITAVVKACNNRFYFEDDVHVAASELNLYEEAYNIVHAADLPVEELDGSDKLIRKALLRSVNLDG